MKDLPLDLTARALKPARLVTITRRDGTVLRIAEAPAAITVGSDTWSPVAGVLLSAVRHVIGGDVPSFEIQAAHSVGGTFDTADIHNGLYDAADVTLYIVNRANPTTLGLMFTGVIEPISYTTVGEVRFDVRGWAQRSAAFVQTYHPMCRTDLFSPLCGLDPDNFDHTGEVATIVDRFNFTVSGLGSPPADGWFNDGVIETETGFAFVTANWTLSTLTIRTYLPICQALLTVGMNITLWPGCDKRIATCFGKFNNAANFQGEPHFLGAAAVSA